MSTVEHTGARRPAGRHHRRSEARRARRGAERRRRAGFQNFIIRMVSLAIFLALWQVAAMNVDPVLFTTPWKVAVAARRHDRDR